MSKAKVQSECSSAPGDIIKVETSNKSAPKELTTRTILAKILPAAAGSFLEFYEFAIFSYMSTEITGNFFADGHGGSLGTWAGFGITFLFRPIGGVFFGWIGDRFGRKPAMKLTIALMLGTTFVQGILPTFYCCGESWGWVGLVLMLFCRIFQGMSAGGELSTAAVYITEVSPRKHLGLNLSWISVTGAFGAWVVAALVVFLCQTAFTPDEMLAWGWRLPYLSSLIPGFLIIIGRNSLEETPEFTESKQERVQKDAEAGTMEGASSAAVGIAEVVKKHGFAVLVGSLGCAAFGAVSFVPSMYGVQFVQTYDGLAGNVITLSELINYLIPAVTAPLVGMLIDVWGAGRTLALSVLLGGILAPAPLLYWWAHVPPEQALLSVFLGESILGVGLALMTATYLWIVELFPVHVRVTGVSVAYNIGIGIFGGMGPLISDAGNRVMDPRGLVSAPALYTTLIGIMSFGAIMGSRILAKRGLMTVTHIREQPY